MTLWSAVVRQTSSGRVVGGQESVDIQQALRLHTMGSAYAAHEENVKGSIEVGKHADLVVWSDDMFSVPTDKIRNLRAELTIVGGQVIHQFNQTNLPVVPGSKYLPTPYDDDDDFLFHIRLQPMESQSISAPRLAMIQAVVRPNPTHKNSTNI